MNPIFFLIIALASSSLLVAQSVNYSIGVFPELELRNTLPLTQNSITWNTHNFIYYTSGVDSSGTVIESFEDDGESNHQQNFTFQAKGVWYNSLLDFLEAYSVQNNSSVSFFLDEEGIIENQDTLNRIAELQEVGLPVFTVYNNEKDVYAYLEPVTGIIVEVEPYSGEISNYIPVNFNNVDKKNIAIEQLLYTGLDEAPYALADPTGYQLCFINKNGEIVHQLPWPAISYIPRYFGYTNGLFWLYNSDNSVWSGYAIR